MRGYGRVWTVYRKELMETLRDRRTLMAMVLVPIVLYPVLMVVLVEAVKSESGRQEREHYRVCVPDVAHKRWIESVLANEARQRKEEARSFQADAKAVGKPAEDAVGSLRTELGAEQITLVVAEPGTSLWDLVSARRCHAAIVVEPGPNPDDLADGTNRIVQILYSDTDPLSEVVYRQFNYILSNEADRIVRARVTALSGSAETLVPLVASNISTTSPDRQFAKVLAMIVPFLLVTMTVTGAMYPAIDLTAGERERGTLETLAVSPVPVGQIVAGKFGVIVTIAMATTALNLGSMTAMIHFSKLDQLFTASRVSGAEEELAAEAMIQQGAPSITPGGSLQQDHLSLRRQLEVAADQQMGFVMKAAPIVLAAMVPFAVLFGALMLAVCSFARTFKEAQNYMMPVMMAAIMPAMIVSYMPTIKLEGAIQVIPVANIVVLMRELFLGNVDFGAMGICLGSTCFYAIAAVTVANRVYGNEAVLFSDVGSYKTLLLRRFMRPQRFPSAAFALLTVAVVFPFYFYAQSSLISPQASGLRNLAMVALTQVMLFGVLVGGLAWYVKLDLRETFSLRGAGPLAIIGTLLLVVSVAPMSNLVQQIQLSYFPMSESAQTMLEQQERIFRLDAQPWWALVLVLAVVPGICEEICFRGFLMAGLRERLAGWKVVLIVGLVFGLFHVQLEKLVLVSLLGMLLTYICLRTGSILPAILVHIANNGLHLASEHFVGIKSFYNLPARVEDLGRVHFGLGMAIFTVIFVAGIVLIAMQKRRTNP